MRVNTSILLCLIFLTACSGPSNYDECILESMKGVESDLAARLIAHSCGEKFPVKPIAQKR